MSTALRFTVTGTPVAQGSKRAFIQHGHARVVDANQKPLRTWRQDVVTAALAATQEQRTSNGAAEGWRPLEGPVRLEVVFYMPRPKYHFGAHGLKPSAPVWCDKKPDIDKTLRAIADALTDAGLYRDDGQIVDVHAVMAYAGGRYAELDHPGAVITLAPLVAPQQPQPADEPILII